MSSKKYTQRLISINQAAESLGISRWTVKRLITRGALRAINLNDGLTGESGVPLKALWRIPQTEVERLVNG